MWQYFYAHASYHMVRWFPQGNRLKMSLFLMIGALLLPVPQLFVVLDEQSSRFCEQPLLAMAISSIVLTFVTIGFTFLFCLLIPVPRSLKIIFHIFGVGCLIHGLMYAVYMFQSEDECFSSVYPLFLLSQFCAYLSILSTGLFVVMLPFWIINKVKTNLVLDPYTRTGICYEPTKCCTCLWHI